MENTDKSIVVYKSSDGLVSFDVGVDQETVWLSLNQLCSLFERDKSVISRHITNIYKEQELEAFSTVAKFATVQQEGGRKTERNIEHYNLDVIISVGYRVKSKRGIEFRQWATKVLKDYLLTGYAANTRKLREIEVAIKAIVEDGQLHKSITQKLVTDIDFIKKMLEPKSIVVNVEHKPVTYLSVSISSETKTQIQELAAQLATIKDLVSEANIRKLIEEQLANLKRVDQKTAQTGLAKFMQSLNDKNSQIAKALTEAGVSFAVLKKVVKLGLALLNQLKPL